MAFGKLILVGAQEFVHSHPSTSRHRVRVCWRAPCWLCSRTDRLSPPANRPDGGRRLGAPMISAGADQSHDAPEGSGGDETDRESGKVTNWAASTSTAWPLPGQAALQA